MYVCTWVHVYFYWIYVWVCPCVCEWVVCVCIQVGIRVCVYVWEWMWMLAYAYKWIVHLSVCALLWMDCICVHAYQCACLYVKCQESLSRKPIESTCQSSVFWGGCFLNCWYILWHDSHCLFIRNPLIQLRQSKYLPISHSSPFQGKCLCFSMEHSGMAGRRRHSVCPLALGSNFGNLAVLLASIQLLVLTVFPQPELH